MRIGIDIDGVLTDIERWQLDYGSKYYYENFGKDIINSKGYDTPEIFGASTLQDKGFWAKYFKDYAMNVEIRAFADEVTRKLKDDGHELYIITARGAKSSHSADVMSYEENKMIVEKWLNERKIVYDRLILSEDNKLNVCLDNKIDIMIEDCPNNILNISKKIPVICFDTRYNQECTNDNIIRCYSWYDIYAKINTILGEKSL